MQKHIFGIAIISLLLSSCCDDSGELLLNIVLPDDAATPCDDSKSTIYESSFNVEKGAYLPPVYVKKGTTALYTTPDGLAWYDLQSKTLHAEVSTPIAQKAFSYPKEIHQYGNLACAASATGMAVVDMEAHKLVWERNLPDCTLNGSSFTGVGNKFFAVGKVMDADGKTQDAIYAGNMESSEDFGLFLTPQYSRQFYNSWCGFGKATEIKAFEGANTETYLLIAFFEPIDQFNLVNFMGLYNLTRQTWVYERAPLNQVPSGKGVQNMSLVSGIVRMPFGDSIFVWDVMAGKMKSSIGLPVGSYGHKLQAGNIWSNESLTLVNTNESEVIAYDNTSNAIKYRISGLNGASLQVDLEYDLFFLPSNEYYQIFELSTGHTLSAITSPCQNEASAQFTDAHFCRKEEDGRVKLALQGGETVYQYDVKR